MHFLLYAAIQQQEQKLNYAVMMLNHCFDSPRLKYKLEQSILKEKKFQKFIKLWNNGW